MNKPIYDFDTDESDFFIQRDENAIFEINSRSYTVDAEVRLHLLPEARIYIHFENNDLETQDMNDLGNNRADYKFFMGGKEIETLQVQSNLSFRGQMSYTMKLCPKFTPCIGYGNKKTKINKAVFHLFNFTALDDISFLTSTWQIDIKKIDAAPRNLKKLKEEGGYRLTHIGSIERCDGQSFNGEELGKCLALLNFAISFAKGNWCNAVCTVGYDKNKFIVWREWSAPREPWKQTYSWFSPTHRQSGDQFENFAPCFIKKCTSPEWQQSLQEIIYWYLAANTMSVDLGIILTQSGIEKLAYQHVVKDKKMITKEGFKKLWASDIFRLFFSSLNIPLDIPEKLSESIRQSPALKDFKPYDAPHLLTEVRNFLIHPEKEQDRDLGVLYYEIGTLGLWYLELGILAVCGYEGTYSNRVTSTRYGQVENVPWLQDI